MQRQLEKKSPRLARIVKEIEIQFRWLLIWLVQTLVASGSGKAGGTPPRSPKRILILRYDKIGDIVVTLPAIHALKRKFPEAELDILTSPANSVIVSADAAISNVYKYHKGNWRRTWRVIKKIRRRQYDITLDLITGSSATSLILMLLTAGASYRIGIGKDGARQHYDRVIGRKECTGLKISRQYLRAVETLTGKLNYQTITRAICLPDETWRKGEELVNTLKGERYKRVVGINISAGMPNRDWGVSNYCQLAMKLAAANADTLFLITFAPEDLADAQEIAAFAGKNVNTIPAGLTLIEVIAVIRQLNLIMSPDTSICHIAASLDVPLLALYTGDERHFQVWQPDAGQCWILRSDDFGTIHAITVDECSQMAQQAINELSRKQEITGHQVH